MPVTSSRTDPGTAADAAPSPAVDRTLAPNQEDKRPFSVRGGERAKRFAAKLKANAQWMKQFLHGAK